MCLCIVNKAEIDVFLEVSSFSHDPADVGNLISGSSTLSKTSNSLVSQMVEVSACNAGDPGSIHGSGRSPEGGNGNPLQYSGLENPMDGEAWCKATVHGIAKSQTQLSDFTFTLNFHALEKEMATHPSVLAWRIPGTEEPGGLQSMGSLRVRHN